jgi:hypothetical protein
MARRPKISRHGGSRTQFFSAVGKLLYDWRGFLELWTIIPLVEALTRFWYRLDPRLYSEALRIRKIYEGQVPTKSDRYVIFVLYTKSSLPIFTTNLIDAVARTQLNLVVVCNAKIDAATRAYLLDNSNVLIERTNLGRDFGAYRDAIRVLTRRKSTIERLILLNDSVFFFKKGLDWLLNELNGTHDFVGLTEVFQFHYHVQSFMLSFGQRVLQNERFIRFWKRFRPISTRRWSIHKGEVRLTRELTKAGFRPHILYQAVQLAPHMRDRPAREVLEAIQLLPTELRWRLFDDFDEILGSGAKSASIATLEAISQGVRSVRNYGPKSEDSILSEISSQAAALDRWSLEILVNRIIETIAERNQVHVGGFLFMRYLGMPVIKRDIFYREVYSLEDVYRILSEFQEPLRDEVMSDLRRAGTAMHLNPLLKILYRHGSI